MRKQGCKKWALYVPQLVALLLVFNLNLNATAFSQHQRLNLKLKDTERGTVPTIRQKATICNVSSYRNKSFINGPCFRGKNCWRTCLQSPAYEPRLHAAENLLRGGLSQSRLHGVGTLLHDGFP